MGALHRQRTPICLLKLALLLCACCSISTCEVLHAVSGRGSAMLRMGKGAVGKGNLLRRLRGGKDEDDNEAMTAALSHKRKGTDHWIDK
eukprot:1907380-Rhodomonas_salina.2